MTKSKTLYIGFGTRVLILGLITVFGFVMTLNFLVKSLSRNVKYTSVISSSNVDYKVHLKNNNYYDTNVLPADMKYVASLIDYIDTDLIYSIKSTENLHYNYSYSIDSVTRVYGDNSKTKILFEKTTPILSKEGLTSEGDDISIKENIKVDYHAYNSLISSFKTSYALTTVSDVSIALHVKATAESDTMSQPVNINEISELVIPLTEQTVDVQITKIPSNNYSFIDNSKSTTIGSKKYLALFIFYAISTVILSVNLFRLLGMTSRNEDTKYKRMLNRILKENDLIIANVDYEINEDEYKIVNVESFEELRDIHDNIGSPILYTSIHKDQKSTFVIIKDNFLYKYVLKATNLEKKKK